MCWCVAGSFLCSLSIIYGYTQGKLKLPDYFCIKVVEKKKKVVKGSIIKIVTVFHLSLSLFFCVAHHWQKKSYIFYLHKKYILYLSYKMGNEASHISLGNGIHVLLDWWSGNDTLKWRNTFFFKHIMFYFKQTCFMCSFYSL